MEWFGAFGPKEHVVSDPPDQTQADGRWTGRKQAKIPGGGLSVPLHNSSFSRHWEKTQQFATAGMITYDISAILLPEGYFWTPLHNLHVAQEIQARTSGSTYRGGYYGFCH